MASVQVRNVRKIYRRDSRELPVLDGLSLEISPGEFVALMGPSGSGKTTLLNLIGGIDQPTSGEVVVGGTDIVKLQGRALAKWRARNIGFIFQLYNLIPVLTALQNVELPLLLVRMSGRERRRRAQHALEIVGLGDRLQHYPRQLSGGQEQRVAIARAIVTEPLMLLADEPTGALDTENTAQIMELFCELHRAGMTVIIVTHEAQVAAYAQRVIRFRDGRIVADENPGTPA